MYIYLLTYLLTSWRYRQAHIHLCNYL